MRASIFEAAGAVGKINPGLKLKHHLQIKLAQIGETHCRQPYCDIWRHSLNTPLECHLISDLYEPLQNMYTFLVTLLRFLCPV